VWKTGECLELNHEALRAACFEAARKTMQDARPTDLDKIRKLADTFYGIAWGHLKRIAAQGRDPDILSRAVSYLAHTHAIPPMHDSTEWFFFMLRALVELSCPEVEQNGETSVFLSDIRQGIHQTCVRLENQ
jgi:hypothetical protein